MNIPFIGEITLQDGFWMVVITAFLEAITIFFRFYLGKKSTRDTRFLAHFTLGLRIHHGYVGLALLFLNQTLADLKHLPPEWWVRIGGGLIMSDIIHHLLLWVVTGNAEFDLVYPKTKAP